MLWVMALLQIMPVDVAEEYEEVEQSMSARHWP